MNLDDAKVWMEYSESDLRAAQTLLESRDFFPLQIVSYPNNVQKKPSKLFWCLKK